MITFPSPLPSPSLALNSSLPWSADYSPRRSLQFAPHMQHSNSIYSLFDKPPSPAHSVSALSSPGLSASYVVERVVGTSIVSPKQRPLAASLKEDFSQAPSVTSSDEDMLTSLEVSYMNTLTACCRLTRVPKVIRRKDHSQLEPRAHIHICE